MEEPQVETEQVLTLESAIGGIASFMPGRKNLLFEVILTQKNKWKICGVKEVLDNQVMGFFDDEDSEDEDEPHNPLDGISFPKVSDNSLNSAKRYTG